MQLVIALLFFIFSLGQSRPKNEEFELSIVHFNDFHARFDEVSPSSGTCKKDQECHGGVARLHAAVGQLLAKRKNAILLNAGDNFSGTMYHTMFKWNMSAEFMRTFPVDAYTLGNHDFDDHVADAVSYVKALGKLPLMANVNDDRQPDFQGLHEKSAVLTVGGRRIGVVGVVLQSYPDLSNTDNLVFTDELAAANEEAERLKREDDVFTVILLTHCGYDVDKTIAARVSDAVSVIVGSHSHTLLYTGTPPDGSTAHGPYPTIVENESGRKIYIVQASAYTKYLGDLIVRYDDSGNVIKTVGNPIYLSADIEPDEYILSLLEPYKKKVEETGSIITGQTEVLLDSDCGDRECNFGNFIADAIVYSFSDEKNIPCQEKITIGIINSGGIRTSIPPGNITVEDLLTAQSFSNTFDSGNIKGIYLKEAFEHAVSNYPTRLQMLQISGINVTYDLSRPLNDRVTNVAVLNACTMSPEPIDLNASYRIGINSYLVKGKDGFTSLAYMEDHAVGKLDVLATMEYVGVRSPVDIGIEGRIIVNGV